VERHGNAHGLRHASVSTVPAETSGTATVHGTRLRRAMGRVRRAPRRLAALAERLAFPGADSPLEHWQRLALNKAVDEHMASLDPPSCTAVEISGDTHGTKPWKEYSSLAYPEFDLCAPITDRREYDVVICEQVLEHVADPWAAASNLRELSAPGGHVIVSTPFLVRVHEVPLFLMKDYWRFTPRGLRTLLEGVGLEVATVGSWGNRQCVVGNFSRWSGYRPWHSLQNEPDFPIQVWAFARNSTTE
jgi:SAM-dependent methyltransferase